MKALTISTEGEFQLQIIDKSIPEVGEGQCLVKIHAAALNRRDFWVSKGKYPGIKGGATLGSDGCGEVVEGPDRWLGKTVLINPNIHWGDDPSHQGEKYQILGMPTDGTIAEYIAVDEDRLVEKPQHLTDEEACGVPLAGLTAYRALFAKAKVKKGDRVLITGIGGGVSQFALSFAVAVGADAYVNSSSDEKLTKAVGLGAVKGYNYQNPDWWKEALEEEKFDAIIDSAGGNALNNYLRIIRPGGKIVVYGSTTGKTESLDVFRLFWSQSSIHGSTMGNDEEFKQMVSFISDHGIRPVISEIFEFKNAIEAVKYMADPQSTGKIVIRF